MKAQGFTRETVRSFGATKLTFPEFNVGDTIIVSCRIKEGDKERTQLFQGDVIAMHKKGISSTFTIRKIGSHSIAVERIFPFHTPLIEEIKVVKRGDVRRAKLFYIRDRVGKSARIKEKIVTKEQLKAQAAAAAIATASTPAPEEAPAPVQESTDKAE